MRLGWCLLLAGAALAAVPQVRSGVGTAVGEALTPPPPPPGTTVTGTLLGSDGRAVSALLGFDLKDREGRTLAGSGCVRSPRCPVDGYGIAHRVNARLGALGSSDTRRWATTWSVRVPLNTARVFIEAYPSGVGHSGTDESRYGHSYRRNLRLPYDQRINLRLPLVCEQGGSTGRIEGRATMAGRPVQLSRVTTWSQGPDNNLPRPVLGWNVGTAAADGSFLLPNLPPGQEYQVLATAPDGRVERTYGVPVSACRATPLHVAFPAPAGRPAE